MIGNIRVRNRRPRLSSEVYTTPVDGFYESSAGEGPRQHGSPKELRIDQLAKVIWRFESTLPDVCHNSLRLSGKKGQWPWQFQFQCFLGFRGWPLRPLVFSRVDDRLQWEEQWDYHIEKDRQGDSTHTLITIGPISWHVSPKTLKAPPLQKKNPRASLRARAMLGFFRPSCSLQCLSNSFRLSE